MGLILSVIDFFSVYIGRAVILLASCAALYFRYKKLLPPNAFNPLSPTEIERIEKVAAAAKEDLTSGSSSSKPNPSASSTSSLSKTRDFERCTFSRAFNSSKGTWGGTNSVPVWPTRKGNVLYLYPDAMRGTNGGGGAVAVLPLNAFRVAVTNKKGEDPTIKDGQMFGKGKTVTLFPVQTEQKEKKNKKKVKSKESGGEEGGKSEDDDSAKTRVDEETAGPVVNGAMPIPLVPSTDIADAQVPETFQAPAAAPLTETVEPNAANGTQERSGTNNSTSPAANAKPKPVIRQEAPYVFDFKLPVHKHDFYMGMVEAVHNAPTFSLVSDRVHYQRLRKRLAPIENPAEAAFSAILGRYLLGVHNTEFIMERVLEKIRKKTDKVVEERKMWVRKIEVLRINLGSTPPVLSEFKLDSIDDTGGLKVLAHLDYSPVKSDLDSYVTAHILVTPSIGPKVEADVYIKGIRGDMQIVACPAPSNRFWYGFTKRPEVDLEIGISVFQLQLLSVSGFRTMLHRYIMDLICELVVDPGMDDVAFFDTTGRDVRGGIFDDSVAAPLREHYELLTKIRGSTDIPASDIAGTTKAKVPGTALNTAFARDIATEDGPIVASPIVVQAAATLAPGFPDSKQGPSDAELADPGNGTARKALTLETARADAVKFINKTKAAWIGPSRTSTTLASPASSSRDGLARQTESATNSDLTVNEAGAPARPASTHTVSPISTSSGTAMAPTRSSSSLVSNGVGTETDVHQPTSSTSTSPAQNARDGSSTTEDKPAKATGSLLGVLGKKLDKPGMQAFTQSLLATKNRKLETWRNDWNGQTDANKAKAAPTYLPPGQGRDAAAGPSGHSSRISLDGRPISVAERLTAAARDDGPRGPSHSPNPSMGSIPAAGSIDTAPAGRPRSGTASSTGSTASGRPLLHSSPSKATGSAPGLSTTFTPALPSRPSMDTDIRDTLISTQPGMGPGMSVPKMQVRAGVVTGLGNTPGVGVSRTISAEREDASRGREETLVDDNESRTSSVPPPLPARIPATDESSMSVSSRDSQTSGLSDCDTTTAPNGAHSESIDDGEGDLASAILEDTRVPPVATESDAEIALRKVVAKQQPDLASPVRVKEEMAQ